MDLRLSDRQEALQKACAQFFASECTPALIRDMEHPLGGREEREDRAELRRRMWRAFVKLGAAAVTIAPEFGGKGWGQSEALTVAETAGRALYHSPYLDTLTAIDILQSVAASPAQQTLLAEIADGQSAVALAVREDGRANPSDLASLALECAAQPAGWTVRGAKRFVACAEDASHLLLIAPLADGPTLFLVALDRPGIALRRHDEIGRGALYAVSFDGLELTRDDLLGEVGAAAEAYGPALARARTRHAAYLVGLCQALLDITLHYVKNRQQFGRPIASFQALAFRLAGFAARIEAARLLAYYAAWQADQGQPIERIACELLAMTGELAQEFTADAMQMHGSYGLTEQADAQRYYRRAAADALLLGTPTQLRAEAAALLAEGGDLAQPELVQERGGSTVVAG